MKTEIIHKKIIEIMKLVLKINSKTKHHMFFDYSGHANVIIVRAYLEGWAENKKPDLYKDIYMDSCSKKEAVADLNFIIERLNIILDMSMEDCEDERAAG